MYTDEQLNQLFLCYVKAFTQYDLTLVKRCYYLPCTLHTPDKIAYLDNEEKFEQAFIDIFTVLKHANISKIEASKASYQPCCKNAVDVCVDWLFYDDNNTVFTDFTAFYHIVNDEQNSKHIGKIVSVVSHERENTVELAYPFVIG